MTIFLFWWTDLQATAGLNCLLLRQHTSTGQYKERALLISDGRLVMTFGWSLGTCRFSSLGCLGKIKFKVKVQGPYTILNPVVMPWNVIKSEVNVVATLVEQLLSPLYGPLSQHIGIPKTYIRLLYIMPTFSSSLQRRIKPYFVKTTNYPLNQ